MTKTLIWLRSAYCNLPSLLRTICFLFWFLPILPLCSQTEIIVCGDDQVIIFDLNLSDSSQIKTNWIWQVSEATSLPEVYQKYMIPTDECKSVEEGKKILITSSGGGVVLVERLGKTILFYAHTLNAHSAEILPNNRIVVALSTAHGGNSIELYDMDRPEKVIFRDSLYSAHGVVWMDSLQLLFALGYSELRAYRLLNWQNPHPSLEMVSTWTLPDESGHDLQSIDSKTLILSTHNSVWTFDVDTEHFTPFEPLINTPDVKSVNYNLNTGKLIYTKGEINWWSHHIYSLNPDKTLIIPHIRLYKARVIGW